MTKPATVAANTWGNIMIRSALLLLGTAACFSAPAVAQSFSHTHGHSGYHSHDTTITVTHGDCCKTTHTCGHSSHTSHSSHHGHGSHHGNHHAHGHSHNHQAHHGHHSGHRSRSGHVTRTYTRTYVHPHTTTRTYTRTVPAAVTHTTYPGQHIVNYPAQVPHYNVQHTDRDKPWAHYDRNWKSRTRTGYRHRH